MCSRDGVSGRVISRVPNFDLQEVASLGASLRNRLGRKLQNAFCVKPWPDDGERRDRLAHFDNPGVSAQHHDINWKAHPDRVNRVAGHEPHAASRFKRAPAEETNQPCSHRVRNFGPRSQKRAFRAVIDARVALGSCEHGLSVKFEQASMRPRCSAMRGFPHPEKENHKNSGGQNTGNNSNQRDVVHTRTSLSEIGAALRRGFRIVERGKQALAFAEGGGALHDLAFMGVEPVERSDLEHQQCQKNWDGEGVGDRDLSSLSHCKPCPNLLSGQKKLHGITHTHDAAFFAPIPESGGRVSI